MCTTNARRCAFTRSTMRRNAISSRSLYGTSPMTPKANASGERAEAAHAQARSAQASSARALVILERFEPIDRGERFLRRERVGIESRERLAKRRGVARQGRLRRGEEVAGVCAWPQLALELGEMATRGAHDILGNAGEMRDMDAVGAIGGTALDAVQEDDAVAVLDGVDVNVHDIGKLGGELRELEVMGREERVAAHVLGEMAGDRVGEGEPVEGRRAAADLVHENEAPRRGV